MSERLSPERSERRVALLKKRVRKALVEAGIQVGGDHLIIPMVKALIEECETVRRRGALIIRKAVENGCVLVNPAKVDERDALASLADYVEHHYVDEDGEIQVAFPEED
jgi:hypothetical protein